MDKETIVKRTPPPPKVSRDGEPSRSMSMDEAKKLIHKVSKDHAGLFRRLAK
jgi:hypothetical protein